MTKFNHTLCLPWAQAEGQSSSRDDGMLMSGCDEPQLQRCDMRGQEVLCRQPWT